MKRIAEMFYQTYLDREESCVQEKELSDAEEDFVKTLNKEQVQMFNKLETLIGHFEERKLLRVIEYMLRLSLYEEFN